MFDKGDYGVAMFIGSFLLGASVGAACGMLLAPTSGVEARGFLANALTAGRRRRRRVRRRGEPLIAASHSYASYDGQPFYHRKARPDEGDN